MAEYEHQFKVIDEAQKTFEVREKLPKDIKREFLTGPEKFDEIMEKLEISIDEIMADDGPVPMDLGNVGTHDAKTTQSDHDVSNDMSYDDVCVRSRGKDTKLAQKSRQEWAIGKRDDEGKKGGKRLQGQQT